MNWLYELLSPRMAPFSLTELLLNKLPDFLYSSVSDRAYAKPTTSEILNNLIKHDFIIHPSTGDVLTAYDVNKLIADRLKTISHNMAQEPQVVSRIQPILASGLLPEYQSSGWAGFLKYL